MFLTLQLKCADGWIRKQDATLCYLKKLMSLAGKGTQTENEWIFGKSILSSSSS
jgi:hypothetical protein